MFSNNHDWGHMIDISLSPEAEKHLESILSPKGIVLRSLAGSIVKEHIETYKDDIGQVLFDDKDAIYRTDYPNYGVSVVSVVSQYVNIYIMLISEADYMREKMLTKLHGTSRSVNMGWLVITVSGFVSYDSDSSSYVHERK